MKNIIYFLAISILACTSNNYYQLVEGEIDTDYLFNSPNTAWFQKNYESYIVDEITLNKDFMVASSGYLQNADEIGMGYSGRKKPKTKLPCLIAGD